MLNDKIYQTKNAARALLFEKNDDGEQLFKYMWPNVPQYSLYCLNIICMNSKNVLSHSVHH